MMLCGMFLLRMRPLNQLAALNNDFGETTKAGKLPRLWLLWVVFEQRRAPLTDNR
jgi:hypothetical protein